MEEACALQIRGPPVGSALELMCLHLWAKSCALASSGYRPYLVCMLQNKFSKEPPFILDVLKPLSPELPPVCQLLQGTVKGALGKLMVLGSTISGSDFVCMSCT